MTIVPKYDKSHWTAREFYDSFKQAFLNGDPILLDNSFLQKQIEVEKYVSELYLDLENTYHEHGDFDKFTSEYLRFKKSYNVHYRWYVYERFVDLLIGLKRYEEALKEWIILQEEEWSGLNMQFTYRDSAINKLMYFEGLLKRPLINGYFIEKIAPKGSQLTAFGKRNMTEVLLVIDTIIASYGIKSFFELFYKNYSYENFKVKSTFSFDYYKQYFLQNSKSKKVLDWYSSEDGMKFGGAMTKSGMPSQDFVKKAIREKASWILREAENDYRLSIGAKKVGESWISETELFYRLKKEFDNHEVIHHGSPKWLGRQHVDIWFPEHNIGLEYQGLQHDQPVEFFGGIEGYKNAMERDERKKMLFKKNVATLIEVREGYDINMIIEKVKKNITI